MRKVFTICLSECSDVRYILFVDISLSERGCWCPLCYIDIILRITMWESQRWRHFARSVNMKPRIWKTFEDTATLWPWTNNKKCQTHYRVSGKSQWSLSCAPHPLQCCTISLKRVTCPFTEQVGVVATLLTLFWTYLVQMLVGLPADLTTAAAIVVILSLQLNGGPCLTTSDEWLYRNPSLINLVTEFMFHALFYAFLL